MMMEPRAPAPQAAQAGWVAASAAFGTLAAAPSRLDRDQLVAENAHLVKYVVGRLGVSIPGVFDHEDAMQAGVLGLLRAIDGYRADSGASFESYAFIRIRGAILDAVRSLDTVGRAGREAGRLIHRAMAELQEELGRTPREPEVAERLGVSVERYREQLQAATFVTVSLDETDGHDDDDDTSIAETAPDPDAIDPLDEATHRDELVTLSSEVARLGDRERLTLALYYQDGLTFREIGQVLGVTESRVCQIHTEIVLGLRARLVDPDQAHRLGRRRARA